MAEPHELYRQRERHPHYAGPATSRGWKRGIAYYVLPAAVAFGMGFFAHKYFFDGERQAEMEELGEIGQVIACDLENYFVEQQEAAEQWEYMKKLQRERFPIFTHPGEYSERRKGSEREEAGNRKILLRIQKHDGTIEEVISDDTLYFQ